MGLFGKKNHADEIREKYSIFENGNYSEEDYMNLIDKVEEYNGRGRYNISYGVDDAYEGYYALRAFLILVSSKDIVDNIFGYTEDISDFSERSTDLHVMNGLIRAWKVKEALNPNNVYRLAINNRSFRNFKVESKHSSDDFISKLYEAYAIPVFDESDARDEDSVIFNETFYRFDEEDMGQINNYDNILRENYPELRKEIMYLKKSDGTLCVRDSFMIEAEMSKKGIDYKKLMEDLLIRIHDN